MAGVLVMNGVILTTEGSWRSTTVQGLQSQLGQVQEDIYLHRLPEDAGGGGAGWSGVGRGGTERGGAERGPLYCLGWHSSAAAASGGWVCTRRTTWSCDTLSWGSATFHNLVHSALQRMCMRRSSASTAASPASTPRSCRWTAGGAGMRRIFTACSALLSCSLFCSSGQQHAGRANLPADPVRALPLAAPPTPPPPTSR